MIADIELNFDAEAWAVKRAAYERALLAQVRNHDTGAGTASEAATELIRWYVRFGHMEAPEVQEVIGEGIAAVMLQVARAALDIKPGARADVTPLDFFQYPRKAAKGGPKKAGAKEKLLKLRAAHGDYLAEEDVRAVLTTSGGRSVPQDKWPSTLDRIEDALTDHLAGVYSDVSPEQRRAFVRESFPSIPWGTKGRVVYPAHW